MEDHALTIDGLYEVLSDATRRTLLWALVDGAPDIRLSVPEDLPETAADHRRTRVQFHHVHLPKLRQHGLVSWDEDAEMVTRGPAFDRVESLLSTLREQERRIDLPEVA